jgi:NADH-quinone oxidoreductase subunit B
MKTIEFFTSQYWLKWIRSESLWVYSINSGCCPDEWLASLSSRYDIERFGIKVVNSPELADVLIVQANLNSALLDEVLKIYDRMKKPKYVLAIGSCVASGGICTLPEDGFQEPSQLHKKVPVDFFLSGCPPRPEAIMHAFLKLKERIKKHG